jgi:hypothetical protein
MSQKDLQIRAQEIINSSPTPITSVEAIKQAIRERYGDYEMLLNWSAMLAAGSLKVLRRATAALPDDAQGRLFDIPTYIWVSTPQGDLYVPKELATSDQVLQWAKETLRDLTVQRTRFERLVKRLEDLALEEPIPWPEVRTMLEEQRQQALAGTP